MPFACFLVQPGLDLHSSVAARNKFVFSSQAPADDRFRRRSLFAKLILALPVSLKCSVSRSLFQLATNKKDDTETSNNGYNPPKQYRPRFAGTSGHRVAHVHNCYLNFLYNSILEQLVKKEDLLTPLPHSHLPLHSPLQGFRQKSPRVQQLRYQREAP